MYRIGYLSSVNPRSAAFFQAFEQRLRELGYIEGQNLAIEYRNAEGQLDRLPGLAAELVRLNVNVIVSATDPATRAAREATKTIPILIVGANFDPVALKFAASLGSAGHERHRPVLSASRPDCQTIRAFSKRRCRPSTALRCSPIFSRWTNSERWKRQTGRLALSSNR